MSEHNCRLTRQSAHNVLCVLPYTALPTGLPYEARRRLDYWRSGKYRLSSEYDKVLKTLTPVA